MQNIEIWKILHTPFVLSEVHEKYHKCQWCAIDSGVAGCLLCGKIHECTRGECKEVTLTEDCYVCNITGVCLNRCISPEFNEYMDTTLPCQESLHMQSNDESTFHMAVKSNVLNYIRHVLVSENAYKNWISENSKKVTVKCSSQNQILQSLSEKKCLILALENKIKKMKNKSKSFESETREILARKCEKYIVFLLLQTHSVSKLSVRNSEIRNHAIGLLYLMRYGVYVFDVCILPQIQELQIYLPRESNLNKNFDFKAKFITDTENKFKFAFRMMKKNEIERFIQVGV